MGLYSTTVESCIAGNGPILRFGYTIMRWKIQVWDGFSNREIIREGTYQQVVNSCAGYPPGYIWSVSAADSEV